MCLEAAAAAEARSAEGEAPLFSRAAKCLLGRRGARRNLSRYTQRRLRDKEAGSADCMVYSCAHISGMLLFCYLEVFNLNKPAVNEIVCFALVHLVKCSQVSEIRCYHLSRVA